MGDIDGGGLQPLVHQLDLGAHLHSQLGVEVRQRFVEQIDLRPPRQRAPHGDPLLLATGQLRGLASEQVFDLQQLGHPRYFLLDLRAGHLAHLQTEGDVVAHAHRRVQRVGLEHHGDIPILGAGITDVGAIDANLAAGDGLQPGDAVHQRGFATTGRPDQDQELTVVDLQVDVLQGVGQPAGVAFADIA